MSDPNAGLHVTFVCTGKICRSPMAEKMFTDQLRRRGICPGAEGSSASRLAASGRSSEIGVVMPAVIGAFTSLSELLA